MKFEIITETERFFELEKKWKDLEAQSQTVLVNSSFDWVKNWWLFFKDRNDQKFGYNKQLLIFVFYSEDNSPECIAPLVRLDRKYFGVNIRFLELLGQQWFATYNGFIYKREFNISETKYIASTIKKNSRSDLIYFNHLPSTGGIPFETRLYPYSACPQIQLNNFLSIDEFKTKNYSKNLKSNYSKAQSWCKKMKINLTSNSEIINDNNFNDIIKIAESKVSDNKEFKYGDTLKRDFRRRIYEVFKCESDFVKINGENVAYLVNVEYKGTKIGIDTSYNRAYPNKLMLGSYAVEQSISRAIFQKLNTFDFGPGIDNYKFKFTKKASLLNIYCHAGSSFFSHFFFPFFRLMVSYKSKRFIKQLYNVLNK